MTAGRLAALAIAGAACGLALVALGSWAGPACLAASALTALAAWAIAETETTDMPSPLTVAILDQGGHLAVTVDRHDGRGPYLVMTTPTHRGAQTEAGRRAGMAEAITAARAKARTYGVIDEVLITDDRTASRRRQVQS